MQNYYQFIIPRLNGDHISKEFKYHLSLVKKGIAGFIIFGGRLETVRKYIRRLQDEADMPLIIASDLEQGLGQQIKGGTLFPPAMAVASAILKDSQKSKVRSQKSKLLTNTFRVMAEEALYAGINTIFAPLLDINTNPKNPIISVRSFGEDRDTVSFFGCEMIKTLQHYGIATCGKHFPGHGDTEVDSHIKLPTINKNLSALKKQELFPFKKAIESDVKMIMLGHLNVPALDQAGIPVSVSDRAVRFLRENMKYDGILITDAMNMGGVGKISEEKASFMALKAGVDLILHPTDPERINTYLEGKNVLFDDKSLRRFREGLNLSFENRNPDFRKHKRLSGEMTEKAIRMTGDFRIKGDPFVVILNDEQEEKGKYFLNRLKKKIKRLKSLIIMFDSMVEKINLPEDAFVMVAIFSETKAWKGGAGNWIYRHIKNLKNRADLFISFGSPYLLNSVGHNAKMFVYWDSEVAQITAADLILRKNRNA